MGAVIDDVTRASLKREGERRCISLHDRFRNDISEMSIALRDVNWETQADIFRLAEELKLDSDRLLSVIEGCELLGFAMVAQGDVSLTPLGQTFGEASVLARKEIFAVRIRHLPLFRWLLDKAGRG